MLLVLSVGVACARDEEPEEPGAPPEAFEPVLEPSEERPPLPPIPPLEEAERPSQSPLDELSNEALDPGMEPPVLGLPSLEPEVASDADAGAREVEPPLDLRSLEKRLRNTEALGVFTKVALKNQIEDLVDALRRFHNKGRGRLDSLRERYDGLVLKIMSLVQEDEPRLASDIDRSRERIWALLADPEDFAELARRDTT